MITFRPGNNKRGDPGIGKLTLLVFGPILAAAIFCAYHILPFYYYYFELQEQFRSLVRVANVSTEKELQQKIRAQLQRLEIPAALEDVKIERSGDQISITLDYQEVFFVRFQGKDYDLHTFNFHVQAESEH